MTSRLVPITRAGDRAGMLRIEQDARIEDSASHAVAPIGLCAARRAISSGLTFIPRMNPSAGLNVVHSDEPVFSRHGLTREGYHVCKLARSTAGMCLSRVMLVRASASQDGTGGGSVR